MKSRIALTAMLALPASSVAMAQGANMTPFENIADRRQLFVDRSLIERMDGASLKLHEPVSGGAAIRIDKPWEGPANMGFSVLRHGGRYLMYYRAMTLAPGDDGTVCVATSDDGVNWTKPKLGLIERAGSRDNNVVGQVGWLDTRPGVRADECIKAFNSEPLSGRKHTPYAEPPGPKRLVFWASGDGLRFHKLDPQPELVSRLRNCFDGGNTMFWSEAEGQYVLYYRWYDGAGESWNGHRTMARATSRDLLRWSMDVPMTYGDSPREQFYVNNTQPYFRAPHLYIAPAARFMEGRRAITEEQAAAISLKSVGPHRYDQDCSDAVLLTSRAGSTRYDRTFMEAFVRPGPGAGNWASRANYPLTGIFPCGQDRMMFWVSRHYMQDTWHIERLLLRLDGFASVNAPYAGGVMLTKPFHFAGRRLAINYRTSAAGSLRVEILDRAGAPISGHALADCREIIGDEVERTVDWKNGADLGRLAGKTVRLRFAMKDADLYSFRFEGDDTAPPNKPDAGSRK